MPTRPQEREKRPERAQEYDKDSRKGTEKERSGGGGQLAGAEVAPKTIHPRRQQRETGRTAEAKEKEPEAKDKEESGATGEGEWRPQTQTRKDGGRIGKGSGTDDTDQRDQEDPETQRDKVRVRRDPQLGPEKTQTGHAEESEGTTELETGHSPGATKPVGYQEGPQEEHTHQPKEWKKGAGNSRGRGPGHSPRGERPRDTQPQGFQDKRTVGPGGH